VKRLLVVLVAASSLWAAPSALAGWCGTDSSPIDRSDATTGPQFHAVVALPSDAPDTFVADANRLADDVASIQGWWQGQDPTRVPRFDTAVFPGGTCLDISFVRLPSPMSAYSLADADANRTFDTVLNQLGQAGMDRAYKKYLVYVDGVGSPSTVICGTGEGQYGDDGPAYALVWLPTCALAGETAVPKDSIAAHELLHSLGALPAGAPHACPGDDGHPCDSPTDVLYPYTSGAPLGSLVLDFNHDDYYAHSGTWPDIQDSPWLHLLAAPAEPLALTITGGGGSVASDVPGVDCTASCATQWDQGSTLSLVATPSNGFRLVGWSGAGCGGKQDCDVTMSGARAITATFGPSRVPLRRAVVGKGRISCTPACGVTVSAGAPLVLRAVPARGWAFAGWAGACHGRLPLCQPKTGASIAVLARFRKTPVKKTR
jgi:Divergent InlB B-repeat domain